MTEKSADPSADPHLDEIVRKGADLATAGDFAAAEPLFREAVALAPRNAAVLFNLGLALASLKKFEEAERFLIEAINCGDPGNAYIILGDIYESQKRYAESLRCYQTLLQFDSRKHLLLLKVGDLQGMLGEKAAQIANYKLALEDKPEDVAAMRRLTDATVSVADKLWKTDLEAAVRTEEELLAQVGSEIRSRMTVLRQLMVHKEWNERIRRGQAPYHAASVDELFFHHVRDLAEDFKRTSEQVVAAYPKDTDARISLATARFCIGDRHGMEALLKTVPKATEGHMWETVRFAPEFYDELRNFSDEDLERGLPPLIEIAAMPGNPKGIAYLSCNISYFVAFALPMVMSMRERSPTTPVHLHIMDAMPEHTDFISAMAQKLSPLPVAVTIERPGLQNAKIMEARCYYHAIRFIRLYAHLKKYQSPLWLMDVDAVVNRDLSALFQRLPGHDVAVRVRPARVEPWNQFNACMVGANTTPRSLDYFRQIAAYVAYFYQRKGLRWGIDQMAMYGVFADMQDRGCAPSLALLGERDVDYDHKEDGYLWPNSGGGKMGHLDRIRTAGAPPPAPPATTFDRTFERFWQEAVRAANAVGVAL